MISVAMPPENGNRLGMLGHHLWDSKKKARRISLCNPHALELFSERQPGAESCDAAKLSLRREPCQERHRTSLAKAAKHDSTRVDTSVHFGGD